MKGRIEHNTTHDLGESNSHQFERIFECLKESLTLINKNLKFLKLNVTINQWSIIVDSKGRVASFVKWKEARKESVGSVDPLLFKNVK